MAAEHVKELSIEIVEKGPQGVTTLHPCNSSIRYILGLDGSDATW